MHIENKDLEMLAFPSEKWFWLVNFLLLDHLDYSLLFFVVHTGDNRDYQLKVGSEY